jgi:type III secretion protein T
MAEVGPEDRMQLEIVTLLFQEFKLTLVAFLLALPRCYAFMAASQLLPPTAVPRIARNTAILVIAMPLTPPLVPIAPIFVENIPLFMGYFLKEAALGFVMGYLVTWLFWAVQAAGTFIDNQRGAAIASSIDPLQGHESSPLGTLFSQAFITYFFSVGGFLLIIGLLYASFREWPITATLPLVMDAFPAMILEILDHGTRLAFIIAAPIVAVMFFAEFALALVSRFAPQIQVFILAMPIKSALAIAILVFAFPILLKFALSEHDYFASYFNRLYEMLRVGSELP